MSQLGESYNPPTLEKQPEDPKDKEPLTIRIHLLFDGTNNNRDNIAERETFESGGDDESEAHQKFGTVDSSYDNGRTNIAIMEPHIVDGKDKSGYSIVVKVYVEGQGTRQFEKDDTFGLALAVFQSGIYQRARTGINDAFNKVTRKFLKTKPPEDYFIKQVDIDVFGFSRGAATARHAIHVLTTEETVTIQHPSGYGAQTIITNQPLFDRLWLRGYSEMRAEHVKIIFAGLYDTVVSVNASQLAPAWLANNARDQRAVSKAEFALHLAAADEHRSDFPLHRINSAINAGKGAEYYFPGVHSDIGGSYNKANEQLLEPGKEIENAEIRELKYVGSYFDCLKEYKRLIESGHPERDLLIRIISDTFTYRLYAIRRIEGLEYSRASDEENRVINRGKISDLVKDMEYLIEDGWYINNDDENLQIEIEPDYLATIGRLLTSNPIISGSPKSGKLIANRFGITSAYCNIPLRFMIEHSRDMALEIKNELDQRITAVLNSVPGLNSDQVESSLRAYMAKKGKSGSRPDDWLNIEEAEKHYPGIKELRNKHLHMSSRFNFPIIDPGFTPRIKNNLRRRFYYDG